jgi:hypothetical protein
MIMTAVPRPGQRHPILRTMFRGLYHAPGVKRLARRLARLSIQHGPLSLMNRQRIYNLFAADTAEGCRACCAGCGGCSKAGSRTW